MKIICKDCGEFREHHTNGLCKLCYMKKYYLENKEKRKAISRKYRLENKDKVKEVSRKYRLGNPKKVKVAQRKWYLENSEKVKIISKKWYLENLKKAKAISRKYRLENSGKIKKYYQENPEKFREYNLKRRGYGKPEKGIIEKLLNENILKYGIITCEKDKKPCPDNFHIDHIIPVSRGGSNEYNNLQILCDHCNLSKHIEIADYRQGIKNNQMFLKVERL